MRTTQRTGKLFVRGTAFLLALCLLAGQVLAIGEDDLGQGGAVPEGEQSVWPALPEGAQDIPFAPQEQPVSDDIVIDFRIGTGRSVDAATLEENGWRFLRYENNAPQAQIRDYGLHFPGELEHQNLVLEVRVPQAGLYRVGYITGDLSAVGGATKLLIDGKLMGIGKFNTSAPNVPPGGEYLLGNGYIWLSEGTHELNISSYAKYGKSNTIRHTHIQAVILRPLDASAVPAFSSFGMRLDKASIQMDETTQAYVTGNNGEGAPVFAEDFIIAMPYPLDAMGGLLSFSYASDRPDIAEVTESGTIIAKAAGNVVISLHAMVDGRIINTATAQLTVRDENGQTQGYVYDFRPTSHGGTANLWDATLGNSGWRVADVSKTILDRQNGFRNQLYGIQIQAIAGEYAAFDIRVPASGLYTVVFKSGGYTGGGWGLLQIDTMTVGRHNHYGTLGTEEAEYTYKAIYLEAGEHIFRLVSQAKHMYPTSLRLVPREIPPQLESGGNVQGTVDKTELLPGQSAQIHISALLNDGFSYELGHLDNILGAHVTYTSQNPAVAQVDENGRITAVSAGNAVFDVSGSVGGVPYATTVQTTVSSRTFERIEFVEPRTLMSLNEPAAALRISAFDSADNAIEDIENMQIEYEVGNTDVLLLDAQAGTVAPRAVGQSTVTARATLGGITKTAEFTVRVTGDALRSIELAVRSTDLFVGDTPLVKIYGRFVSGERRDITDDPSYEITMTSDNEGVISVQDGVARAVASGNAGLTVLVRTADAADVTQEMTFTVRDISSSKTRRSYYTEEKITAARENSALYSWAQSTVQAAVNKADQYLADYTLDDLWYLVSPQSIPRSYATDPQQKLGSPVTGYALYEQYGNYPWRANPAYPWKLIDPTTNMMFPTNDFAGYYRLGMNDFGMFDPELARQRNDALVASGEAGYLVNILYPEYGAGWGVDDGYGWRDGDNHYTFVAYYAHWHGGWHTSGTFLQALAAFGNAYMYTGDEKYGAAGIILLDRIADLYPDMDTSGLRAQGFLNSDGLANRGKGVGSIWETASVKVMLTAYDQLWPAAQNADAIQFLSDKGAQYNLGILKQSATGIRRHIEDNIVCEIFPAFKAAQIRGNSGMHQSALALAAVVYDTLPETKEWLDYNFKAGTTSSTAVTGGNILAALVDTVDRDGHGNEASPEYNNLWLGNYQIVADTLAGYDLYDGADLYENVKFRKMFTANTGLVLSEKFIPLIGDTGKTGAPASLLNLSRAVTAFEKYGDPVYAQIAHMLNGGTSEGIHSNIFTRNPNQIADDIQHVVDEYGPFSIDSDNLTGYGFAALREGENNKQIFGISYNFPALDILDSNDATVLYENSGTVQFENTTGAGKFIEFGFDVAQADVYYLTLQPFGAATYGVYDIYLDGARIHTLDFNRSGGAAAATEELGVYTLAAGQHSIKFVCTGTTGSNYKMGVVRLELLDEESAAIRDDAGLKNTLRDMWMYYGRTAGHGHADTLNIGIHAFGADLTPELGYPETADTAPHRTQWVNNTVAHNTVVVNQKRQSHIIVADPLHFEDGELVKLVDVSSLASYGETSEYRRTTAMVRVDEKNSYYVDFFRVTGGNEHVFSFHGAEGTVSTEGLALTDQNGGSYAGQSVAYGTGSASGFSWLKNVQRAADPSAGFSVEWDIEDTWNSFTNATDDVRLRLTMLTPVDELALADGIPPQNKPGNPASLRYMLAKRQGTNLESNFVSVIEPYVDTRYVLSIDSVQVTTNGQLVESADVRVVKVTLKNGRTDYIVYALDDSKVYTIDGKFDFQGFFGVFTEENGAQSGGYLCDAALIGAYNMAGPTALHATVESFTQDLRVDNEITVRMDMQGAEPAALVGRFIYIDNGNATFNGSYRIRSVQQAAPDVFTLGIGDVTLINRYTDANDIHAGYVYNIAQGQSAVIPLSAEGTMQGPQTPSLLLSGQSVAQKAVNAYVGTFSVSSDSGRAYSYTLDTDAPDNASFKIEGDRLLTNQPLNYDAQSVYNIRVHADDGTGSSLSQTFALLVREDIAATEDTVVLDFEGIRGAKVEYYIHTYNLPAGSPQTARWYTLPGRYDDAAVIHMQEYGLPAANYTLRVSKGGMGYTVSRVDLGTSAEANYHTIPVATLNVTVGDGSLPIMNEAILDVSQSDWVYQDYSDNTTNQAQFKVFANGKAYKVRINKYKMYLTLPTEEITAAREYDVSFDTAFFYTVAVPDDLSYAAVVTTDWVYNNKKPGDEMVLIRTGQEAELRYMRGGTAEKLKFVLDGTDPFTLPGN